MTTLFTQAAGYFDELQWLASVDERRGVIQTTYNTAQAAFNGYLHVYEKRRQLIFYTLYPQHVERPRLQAAVEFITRANYGLVNGNFEIHWENGGVRFKTSLSLGRADLQTPLLRPLLLGNVVTHFRYSPGLRALIDTDCTAAEALALVEDPPPDAPPDAPPDMPTETLPMD